MDAQTYAGQFVGARGFLLAHSVIMLASNPDVIERSIREPVKLTLCVDSNITKTAKKLAIDEGASLSHIIED